MNDVNRIIIINYNDIKGPRLIKQIKKYNIPYDFNNKITDKNKKSIVILDADYVYEDDLIKYILGTDFLKKDVIFKENIKRIYNIDKYIKKTIKYEQANIENFYIDKNYDKNIIKTIDKKEIKYDITYIDTYTLIPIENHDTNRVKKLKEIILKENIWKVPIIIEKNNNLILDGHHRFEVAKLLNLKKIPAIQINYDEIKVWSLRKNININQNNVINNAKNKKIYPYKTVKHKFPFTIPNIEIELGELL